MPGILALLGYAITYGPQVIKVIQALGPVYTAAKPIIDRLMASGATEDEATSAAFKMLAVHTMTPTEEQVFFDKATGQIG